MELSTASKRSARMLLAAWDSADLEQIRDAADHAYAVLPASEFEAERIEMVREAGSVLRQSKQGSAASADLEASLRLLRHLAGPAVREDVPLGMHACARR